MIEKCLSGFVRQLHCRTRLAVANSGWLPTYVMKIALEKKVVRGLVCEIELGQLEGRAYKDSAATVWMADPTDDRAKVEWVVRAPEGGKVKLIACHEQMGKMQTKVEL